MRSSRQLGPAACRLRTMRSVPSCSTKWGPIAKGLSSPRKRSIAPAGVQRPGPISSVGRRKHRARRDRIHQVSGPNRSRKFRRDPFDPGARRARRGALQGSRFQDFRLEWRDHARVQQRVDPDKVESRDAPRQPADVAAAPPKVPLATQVQSNQRLPQRKRRRLEDEG